MQMMLEMRIADEKAAWSREERWDKEDREREERRIEREEKREQMMYDRDQDRQRELREQKEADIRREERLMTTLNEAQPTVPQTVTFHNQKLPEMKETDDIEVFITLFEASLLSNTVPDDQWKNLLHAHLPAKVIAKIHNVMQDPDSTYEVIKEALLGCTEMPFNTASEDSRQVKWVDSPHWSPDKQLKN